MIMFEDEFICNYDVTKYGSCMIDDCPLGMIYDLPFEMFYDYSFGMIFRNHFHFP